VGNWLYGVAYRTAQEAKRAAARRRAREKKAAHMFRPKRSEDASEKFLDVLYEQLNKLPDKHRVVIVLSDLEGQTRKQVAQVLGVAEGTVASRLARTLSHFRGPFANTTPRAWVSSA
jgi:RNA polymerase sigma factor (sigma-70 family)